MPPEGKQRAGQVLAIRADALLPGVQLVARNGITAASGCDRFPSSIGFRFLGHDPGLAKSRNRLGSR
eukprot:2369037-Rhodomonas_salina.1